jgi:hypothetical protein
MLWGVLFRDITNELPKKSITGLNFHLSPSLHFHDFLPFTQTIIGSRKQYSLITLQSLFDRRWQRQQETGQQQMIEY